MLDKEVPEDAQKHQDDDENKYRVFLMLRDCGKNIEKLT